MTQNTSADLTDLAHSALSSAAAKAKEGGDATAQYIRWNSTQEMVADFKQFVIRNPGASVVCAAMVGLLLGRGISKR
ncbi:MAG: hypothetical protein ND807_12890 [Vicinamibacterales bacterium]|nr:hypothetical protein [Vicinamibacterales bacterium]